MCTADGQQRERDTHTPGVGDRWLHPRLGEEDQAAEKELAQDTRVHPLRAHVEWGGEVCAHQKADRSRGTTHRPPNHGHRAHLPSLSVSPSRVGVMCPDAPWVCPENRKLSRLLKGT